MWLKVVSRSPEGRERGQSWALVFFAQRLMGTHRKVSGKEGTWLGLPLFKKILFIYLFMKDT